MNAARLAEAETQRQLSQQGAAMKTPNARPAHLQSFGAARDTLARAFQNDPMMAYLLPDSHERARRLPWFLGSLIRYCRTFGEVQVTPAEGAVACWLTPGQTDISSGRIFRSGGVLTPFKLGFPAFVRLQALQEHMHCEHARHMPEPHCYLYLLGVDPRRQGQRLGLQLVSDMLERADREGQPCYLETQNEKNVPFYTRLGFRVSSVGEVRSGPSTLNVWTMRREPGR